MVVPVAGRKVLVTGSAGHLGEALVRVLREQEYAVVGLDLQGSACTTVVGSITDRQLVQTCLAGVDTVLHAATLHKPHVVSHEQQAFVDTNITGTLVLLEEAVAAGVGRFVFTSTTSTFGYALTPNVGQAAAWITEEVTPIPKNIYGVTKLAAENLCELAHREQGLPVVVLRTARFFPELDDRDEIRAHYTDANVKANEFLYRRVDLADVVEAHLAAAREAPQLGFGRYIISATTPFGPGDVAELGQDTAAVVRRLFPEVEQIYDRQGWQLMPRLDRVYDNARARAELGWTPLYDFRAVLESVAVNEDPRSPLARTVGAKGYHSVPQAFTPSAEQR